MAQNMNDWMDNHNKYLVNIGFVKDQPGFIFKYSIIIYYYFVAIFARL